MVEMTIAFSTAFSSVHLAGAFLARLVHDDVQMGLPVSGSFLLKDLAGDLDEVAFQRAVVQSVKVLASSSAVNPAALKML